MNHTMNSFFYNILENSAPTLVTDLNGCILYVNKPALCLLERCRPFKKQNSNVAGDNPEPSVFIGRNYSSILEPLDSYEATSLRNHFMNNVQILSKRTYVCRTIKCRTFLSKRPIMLEFSTRTCSLPADNNSMEEKNFTMYHSLTNNDEIYSRNSSMVSSNTINSINGREGIETQGGEKGDEGGGEDDDDENEQFYDATEYTDDDNLENNNLGQSGINKLYQAKQDALLNKVNLVIPDS